jgi:hypothetical protein
MTVTVGGGATPVPFFGLITDTLTLPPSGVITLTGPLAGWPITDAASDTIHFSNPGASSSTLKIWILGAGN